VNVKSISKNVINFWKIFEDRTDAEMMWETRTKFEKKFKNRMKVEKVSNHRLNFNRFGEASELQKNG
jgi:hypothetical protein